MSTQKANRTGPARSERTERPLRVEWSALLATAMLLLAFKPGQAATPAAASRGVGHASGGHSIAVSIPAFSASAARYGVLRSSVLRYSALLCYLQSCAEAAAPLPHQSATPPALSAALSPTELEALLASPCTHRDDSLSTRSTQSTHDATNTHDTETHGLVAADDSATVLSPASAPRHDVTRHLAQYSLGAHEAAFLSGTRANRFLE